MPQAEKLMKQIGVKNVKLTEYEMSIAAHLVDPLSMHVSHLPCSSCSSGLENFPFTLDYIISTSVETHRKYSCDWKL